MSIVFILMFWKDMLSEHFQYFRPDYTQLFRQQQMSYDAMRCRTKILDIHYKHSIPGIAMEYWKTVATARMHQQRLKEIMQQMQKHLDSRNPIFQKVKSLLRHFYEVERYCYERSFAIT